MSNNAPDPVELAREVLDMAHEDDTITVCTIPDNKAAALARAVIDLTGRLDAERFAHTSTAVKVKRIEELAEMMERESGIRRDRGDYPNEMGVSAGDLRRVLNGETR